MNKPIRILVANRPKVCAKRFWICFPTSLGSKLSERFPMTLTFLTLWTSRRPICS